MSEGNALQISTLAQAESGTGSPRDPGRSVTSHIGSNAVPTRPGAREASDLRGDLAAPDRP